MNETDTRVDYLQGQLFARNRQLHDTIEHADNLTSELATLTAERDELRKDLDCGCGVSGCLNMRRPCANCQLEGKSRELATLTAERDELRKTVEKKQLTIDAATNVVDSYGPPNSGSMLHDKILWLGEKHDELQAERDDA